MTWPMGNQQNKFVEWMWRKAETAAVMTAVAWIWIWINSPPDERPARRAPLLGRSLDEA
jgi:hypothetical protein